MLKLNILVLFFLGLMSGIVNSTRFDLRSGTTKCISEDIKSYGLTVGKYKVINPNEALALPDNHRMTFKVTSPEGNNFHHADHADSGHFAFTTPEEGDYSACFWVPDHKPPITLSIEFDWRSGVAAKDWSNVAKKGQVDVSDS